MRGDGHSTDTRGFPFNGRQELWRWIRKLLCDILLRPGNLVKTAQDDTRFSEATGFDSEHKAFKNVTDIYTNAQTIQPHGLRFKLQAVYMDLSSVSVLCLL